MVIAMGYLLEINFIAKGAEAFGMQKKAKPAGATGMSLAAPTLSEGNGHPTPSPAAGEYVHLDDFLRVVNDYEQQAGRDAMTAEEKAALAKGYSVSANGKH